MAGYGVSRPQTPPPKSVSVYLPLALPKVMETDKRAYCTMSSSLRARPRRIEIFPAPQSGRSDTTAGLVEFFSHGTNCEKRRPVSVREKEL